MSSVRPMRRSPSAGTCCIAARSSPAAAAARSLSRPASAPRSRRVTRPPARPGGPRPPAADTAGGHGVLGMGERPQTPLQEPLDRLGRQLVFGALAASGLTLVAGLLRGQSSLLMLRTAVSLGVAAVPEGLPTMVTTALAMGVRRLRATESPGAAHRGDRGTGLGRSRLLRQDRDPDL